MNWKYFSAGVGFLMVAYLTYRGIKRRKRNPDKYPIEGFSVLDIESWGVVIICVIVGAAFIVKSFG
jgi:uncharacterized membrane protein YidH (DUF202 family)